MRDFKEVRDLLHQARVGKAQTQLDWFQAKEKVKQLEAEQARLDRVFNPDDPQHRARQQQIEGRLAEARGGAKSLESSYGRLARLEHDKFSEFAQFSDPRQQVEQLNDSYPFLLLPVRIETRFMNLSGPGGAAPQLWVRIYPDDCAVDTFEATLSKSEVESARRYWADMWRAGSREAEQAAWRSLVGSHGSGRAAWIVQHFRPVNDRPERPAKDHIVLIISTEDPLGQIEQDAAIKYWKAVWLADGDQAEEAKALAALKATLNDDARAEEIVRDYKPFNLNEAPKAPLKKTAEMVSVELLILPNLSEVSSKDNSWTQAARVNVLPDRFVLIGYAHGLKVLEEMGEPIRSPLVVGPDPSAPPEDQIRQEKGEVVVSEPLRWMVDFERAVEWGMGFKISLTAAQAQAGFDRLLVLGLRLSADERQSKTMLETLIRHHQYGRSGFSLVPQGTPTNNTEKAGAGFTRTDDADASFDDYFVKASLFEDQDYWPLKKDGQWLAEWLGIDTEVLKHVRHSDGTDQCEVRAMNVALWPATFGYLLDTMMAGGLKDEEIEKTRQFFNNFVIGRGVVPAVRIGAQPYGILPATAFSRARWMSPEIVVSSPAPSSSGTASDFLERLHKILLRMDADWAEMAKGVSYVGKASDAHQILLDVVGLHSGSVEFYQRYSQSLADIYNRLNLASAGQGWVDRLLIATYTSSGMDLLRALGYPSSEVPDLLEKFFLSNQNLLQGPVIDDRPLSEAQGVRGYTPDGRNYIQWLVDAATSSLNRLREQTGFTDNKPPVALLYLMLRHALMLSYWEVSIRLHLNAQLIAPEDLKAIKREPDFIHMRASATASESRWQYLYKAEPRITNDPSLQIADYIPKVAGKSAAARHLREQIEALNHLKEIPTARLERAFTEHIDCCTYRLDAWKLGLINYQLSRMRYGADASGEAGNQGIYLGAFGWLEDVRPENKVLSPVHLKPQLDAEFNKPGDAPLLNDSSNGGYIHAPSLNHAVTAAVLRNGYLSNSTPGNQNLLSVNLSSRRVRLALSVLEGIRNGQSLGALLGYEFERGLHDRHNLAEVDQFIFKLRKAFPLRADQLSATKTGDAVAIEAIEARNVIDGLSLVNHIKKTGNNKYPFGKALPDAGAAQAAIDAEVERLLDIHDAVADLALAEGVHQAVQGNYERAAATLDAYSKGNFPPDPEVVRTPRSGITLTHRVGLHLESGLDPTLSPVPGVTLVTPRAAAEPALNKWLASVLPSPANLGCTVTWDDPVTNKTNSPVVTQADLQLQPIDLLYLTGTDGRQARTELDDRILSYVIGNFPIRPDARISIDYRKDLSGKTNGGTFFELVALVRSLRALTLGSRPLRSSDIALHNEARQAQEEAVYIDRQRVTLVKDGMEALRKGLEVFHTQLKLRFGDLANQREQILSNIDQSIGTLTALLSEAGRYGIAQTGWGFAFDWKREVYAGVMKKVGELVKRWSETLEQFKSLMKQFNASTNQQRRFELLQEAERLVSTKYTAPLPNTPEDFLTLVQKKSDDFDKRLGEFKKIQQTTTTSLAGLIGQVRAQLPVSDFDLVGITLEEVEKEILTFASDLMSRAKQLGEQVDKLLKAAQAQLDIHDKAARPATRVEALQEAGRFLLGEDFQMIPEFDLTKEQGEELEKAIGASRTGLLHYLEHDLQLEFPVDDWLYGVARVSEKMRNWEQVVMLSSALCSSELDFSEPELQPIQLPYKADDSWLGLKFPPRYKIDSDKLLYTAHHAAAFQKTKRQCGLLVDEWTEVIPGDQETTGIAFHYDRPNSEPPQVMLLVTPTAFEGSWKWIDLVDALNETLEMAKKRAVEPTRMDATAYARFLPATVMAVAFHDISISTNLALNNSRL